MSVKITKLKRIEYRVQNVADWKESIGALRTHALMAKGKTDRKLEKCFVCNRRFTDEEPAYLLVMSKGTNQICCKGCAANIKTRLYQENIKD